MVFLPNITLQSSLFSQMDPKNLLFFFKDSFSLFLMTLKICTFLLLVSETALSDDPQFQACKGDLNCGSGPTISYPFWVQGQQSSFCGFPGFNISCKNSKPILKISGNEYLIVDIDYPDQSFRVSNFEAFGNSCTVPLVSHNLTFNQTPFKLGPGHVDLFLFSNCSASFPNEYLSYSIDCSTDNSTNRRHSLVLFGNDRGLSYVNQSGKCDSLVIAPVDSSWNGNISSTVNRDYKFITAILNKGFQLTWNASRCEICEESGGHCGFDYNMYAFKCFCPDRPHSNRCLGGGKKSTKVVVIALSVGASSLAAIIIAIFSFRGRKLCSDKLMLLLKKKSQSVQRMEL